MSVTPLAEGDGSSAFLIINNSATGFTLKGRPETTEPDGLQHSVATAGTVTRTTSAKDSSGAAISLSDATITLDGTAALGDKWVVTITGGMKAGIYQYVVATGDTISTVDDRLQALIDGTTYSADSNRDITIGNNGEGELPQVGNSFQWSDGLSKVVGNHSMKFGGDVRRRRAAFRRRLIDGRPLQLSPQPGDFLFQGVQAPL